MVSPSVFGLLIRATDLVNAGLDHGLSYVGCPWAIFALMVVALERIVDWNDEIRIGTGVLAVVAGIAVLFFGAPAA